MRIQSRFMLFRKMCIRDSINSPTIDIETEIVFDKLWNPDADVAAILGEIATIYRNNLQ